MKNDPRKSSRAESFVGFRAPPDMLAKIRRLADEEFCSTSAIVRRLLADGLAQARSRTKQRSRVR